MYRSSKISPMQTMKNFNPNNPIHARMMENMRVFEKCKKSIKIRPAMPQHKNNKEKYHRYQEVEEQLVI